MRISKGQFLAFIFAMMASLVLSTSSWALTTVNVTTTNDELNGDANISLREAIQMANLGTGDYLINLVPGDVYNLTIIPIGSDDDANIKGDLDIFRSMSLTIDGNGPGGGPMAVVNGAGLYLPPGFSADFHILDSSTANSIQMTFDDLEMTGADGILGGAVWFEGIGPTDSLTLNNCYIHDNVADDGGGLHISGVEEININSSTISDNAIFPSTGPGGGISIAGGVVVNLNNSTVSGNSAEGGGGLNILFTNFVNIRSSTITNNTAVQGGGVQIIFSTADIKNSILSGNVGTAGNPDCYNPGPTIFFVSDGYNVLGDTPSCPISGPQTGDQSSVNNPMLAALADNGGPTPTHAELAGSPAIDNGDPTGCRDASGAVLSFDQRGAGFPRAADGDNNGSVICDSGAYEAASTITDVEEAIDGLSDYIGLIPVGDLKNANLASTFMNKLNSCLDQLEIISNEPDPTIRDGLINELKNKLINDILAKSNGCGTVPDNNDWVSNCNTQATVRGMVEDILELLDSL